MTKINVNDVKELIDEISEREHDVCILVTANSKTGEQATFIHGSNTELFAAISGFLASLKKKDVIDDDVIDKIASYAKNTDAVKSMSSSLEEEEDSIDDLLNETKKLLEELSKKIGDE